MMSHQEQMRKSFILTQYIVIETFVQLWYTYIHV